MSEQNEKQQDVAVPAELSDASLESVAGGADIVDGGCIPPFPDGCILLPLEPTICF